MIIYFNNLWDGFNNKDDPVHYEFFILLLEKVFNQKCEIGTIENSDVLVESIFYPSILLSKKWRYSILFSGESRINANLSDYTIVLYGQRNHKNIINCPLFVPYLYCSNKLESLQLNKSRTTIPKNEILAIISNPNGTVRNCCLDALEQKFKIVYAGEYRNNIGGRFPGKYNTPQLFDYISQFKFIITMENSREDTYITEKICHGFISKTVPIYWGSRQVTNYFNRDRFINYDEKDGIDSLISEIETLMNNNDQKWLNMINSPVFAEGHLWRDIDDIAKDIRNLLNVQHNFKDINKIYTICNPNFEPARYETLQGMFNKINVPIDLITYLCPTYKHTIDEKIMKKLVKTDDVLKLRQLPMKRAEISLFLNFIAIFKDINKRYLDGLFCTFESDIIPKDNIENVGDLFSLLKTHQEKWNVIHFGQDNGVDAQIWDQSSEPFTNNNDSIRLIQKQWTRCTDTFVWNIKGVQLFLDYLHKNNNYAIPIDTYLSEFIFNNSDFICCWSQPTYFIQGSNHGLTASNIQSDIF